MLLAFPQLMLREREALFSSIAYNSKSWYFREEIDSKLIDESLKKTKAQLFRDTRYTANGDSQWIPDGRTKFIQFPRRVRMRAPPFVWISDKTANFRVESRSAAEYLGGEYLGVRRKRKSAPTKKREPTRSISPPFPLSIPVNNAGRSHPTLCANNWLRTYRTSVIPVRMQLIPSRRNIRAIFRINININTW